ncbi:substrate-binding domain-containing protein [Paraburkholderia tropica]|uniref:substrate-binding domain-containing protein n=1 Tax=Paraburkholderia tropica TaxID=92647 RepID=UPI0038B8D31D
MKGTPITQATEIKYTNHLTLVGLLPDRYRLSTTYSVAVSKGSSSDATARSLIELLTSSATRDIRHSCGFESATGGHLA